jgi:hypothetical protein
MICRGFDPGTISPETQTFVSTTTRSARLADLANSVHYVPFDLIRIEASLPCNLIAPAKEGIEPPAPLVFVHTADSLLIEPGVDGLAHELGYRGAPAGGKHSQQVELALVQINIGTAHRPYIIHRTAHPTGRPEES